MPAAATTAIDRWRLSLIVARELPRRQWTWAFHFIRMVIRNVIYDLVARNRYRWFGRRPREVRDNGAWRWFAACSMTREAALLLFNSVHIEPLAK